MNFILIFLFIKNLINDFRNTFPEIPYNLIYTLAF